MNSRTAYLNDLAFKDYRALKSSKDRERNLNVFDRIDAKLWALELFLVVLAAAYIAAESDHRAKRFGKLI